MWETILLRLRQRGALHSALPSCRGLAEPDVWGGGPDEVHGDPHQEVPQVQSRHREGGWLSVHALLQVSHRVLLALFSCMPKVCLRCMSYIPIMDQRSIMLHRHSHNGQPCQPPTEDVSTSRTVEAEDKDGLGERDRLILSG